MQYKGNFMSRNMLMSVSVVVVLVAVGWMISQPSAPTIPGTIDIPITNTAVQQVEKNPSFPPEQALSASSVATSVSVAGYYSHNDNPKDGYILVTQSGNTIVLSGYAEATSATGVTHFGALNVMTVVDENGKAKVDLSPNHDNSCEMTLAFNVSSPESSHVKVHQTTSGLSCGFGQNVMYFGTYNKQSVVPANLPTIQDA